MADEETNELMMTAIAVVVFGGIIYALVHFMPEIQNIFSHFTQNRHGQF